MPASIALGLVLVSIGVLFNLIMILSGGWPTFYWLLLMGIGGIAILAGLLGRRAEGSSSFRFLRHGNRFGVGIIVIFFVGMMCFLGARRRETHFMRWSYDEPRPDRPDLRHIRLSFESSPSYSVGIYSTNLGACLEGAHSERVPVVFDVTRDFGSVRGFQEVEIGPCREWDDQGSHASVRNGGKNPKSPWGWRLF